MKYLQKKRKFFGEARKNGINNLYVMEVKEKKGIEILKVINQIDGNQYFASEYEI